MIIVLICFIFKHASMYQRKNVGMSSNMVSLLMFEAVDSLYLIILYTVTTIWVFPRMEIPQNGCSIRESLFKMDDLGVFLS